MDDEIKTGEMQGEEDESITVEEDYTLLEEDSIMIDDDSDSQEDIVYQEAMRYKSVLDETKDLLKSKILSILEAGEISSEDTDELNEIRDSYIENYTALKTLSINTNTNTNSNVEYGEMKLLLYKDDDGNVLIDGTAIPELSVLSNNLNTEAEKIETLNNEIIELQKRIEELEIKLGGI